jgi:hypothetical protein
MATKLHSMRQREKLAKQYRVSTRVTQVAVQKFLQSLDCPRALTVYLLYSAGEHEQLAQLETKPLDYERLEDFRDAYAATTLLSKSDFLNLPYDTKARALEKFEKFELLCKHTNSRFRNLAFDPLFKGANVWLLNATIQKIHKVLGSLSVEDVFEHANWGPGVTTLLKGDDATSVNKFQCETGTTRDLYSLIPLDGLPYEFPIWQDHLRKETGYPMFVKGNQIVTVPKDARADRVIAVEPGINLWFQLGIGAVIRRKLRWVGIDLNSQERNRKLAQSGSKTSLLATVDFSSASDSISRRLVEEVLPPDWFRLMDGCRSHYGIQNNRARLWEKFSSMGNGFTFELESLIFYAAATSVAAYMGFPYTDISVYGDDVIIPVECFELYSSFCAFLGFTVNPEKSFSRGHFRESCGGHYWKGVDITPIFLKKIVSSVSALIKFANAIRRLAHRYVNKTACDSRFRSAWHYLYHETPKPTRLHGSEGKGDGAFIVNFDESSCSRARFVRTPMGIYDSQIEGYHSLAYAETGINRSSEGIGLLLARLRSMSPQEQGNNFAPRGRTKIRILRIYVDSWYDLGPWI